MAGIPGFDTIRQALGGLGIGGGAQPAAVPAAPAGAGAQGGGLGMAPPAPAPAPRPGLLDTPTGGDESLSDVGLIRRIALMAGDFAAGAQGDPSYTGQLRARRQAQNDRRTQAYQQAMDLAKKFGEELDQTPLGQVGAKRDLLKKRFEELAGTGGGEMFDTLVGNPGEYMGRLAAFEYDPIARSMRDNPGVTTAKDLKDYFNSAESRRIQFAHQDNMVLPGIVKKIATQGTSTNPEYYAKRRELEADHNLTLEDHMELQQYLPEGQRMTLSEYETARRNPEAFAGLPNFRTGAQVAKNVENQDESAIIEGRTDRRDTKTQGFTTERDKTLHGYRMEEIDAQGKARAATKAATPPKPVKPQVHQWKAAYFGRRMEQAMAEMAALDYDRTALLTGGMQSVLPETMRSEERKKQDQAERNFVTAVLRPESGATIREEEFKDAAGIYFPRAGDSPELVKQKARSRQQALEGLRAEAGEVWDKVPSITGDGEPAAAPPAGNGGDQGWRTDPRVKQLQRMLQGGQIDEDQFRAQAEGIKREYQKFDAQAPR